MNRAWTLVQAGLGFALIFGMGLLVVDRSVRPHIEGATAERATAEARATVLDIERAYLNSRRTLEGLGRTLARTPVFSSLGRSLAPSVRDAGLLAALNDASAQLGPGGKAALLDENAAWIAGVVALGASSAARDVAATGGAAYRLEFDREGTREVWATPISDLRVRGRRVGILVLSRPLDGIRLSGALTTRPTARWALLAGSTPILSVLPGEQLQAVRAEGVGATLELSEQTYAVAEGRVGTVVGAALRVVAVVPYGETDRLVVELMMWLVVGLGAVSFVFSMLLFILRPSLHGLEANGATVPASRPAGVQEAPLGLASAAPSQSLSVRRPEGASDTAATAPNLGPPLPASLRRPPEQNAQDRSSLDSPQGFGSGFATADDLVDAPPQPAQRARSPFPSGSASLDPGRPHALNLGAPERGSPPSLRPDATGTYGGRVDTSERVPASPALIDASPHSSASLEPLPELEASRSPPFEPSKVPEWAALGTKAPDRSGLPRLPNYPPSAPPAPPPAPAAAPAPEAPPPSEAPPPPPAPSPVAAEAPSFDAIARAARPAPVLPSPDEDLPAPKGGLSPGMIAGQGLAQQGPVMAPSPRHEENLPLPKEHSPNLYDASDLSPGSGLLQPADDRAEPGGGGSGGWGRSPPPRGSAGDSEPGRRDELPNWQQARPFDASHYRQVFDEYVSAKERLGQSESHSFEGFAAKLRAEEEGMLQKFKCRAVRFQVLVKGESVSLRPQLIR